MSSMSTYVKLPASEAPASLEVGPSVARPSVPSEFEEPASPCDGRDVVESAASPPSTLDAPSLPLLLEHAAVEPRNASASSDATPYRGVLEVMAVCTRLLD